MFVKLLIKFVYFLTIFLAVFSILLTHHSQIIAKENKKSNKTEPNLPPDFLWCGSSDNNTYLDFCFSSEKICKNFALKRREANGGKLTLCRPTKMK